MCESMIRGQRFGFFAERPHRSSKLTQPQGRAGPGSGIPTRAAPPRRRGSDAFEIARSVVAMPLAAVEQAGGVGLCEVLGVVSVAVCETSRPSNVLTLNHENGRRRGSDADVTRASGSTFVVPGDRW